MNSEWFFLKEAHSLSGLPNDDIPEYIFWGRSNVGKSSLINLLTKKNIAKTSKTPGRTKSLVFFQYNKITGNDYIYLGGEFHEDIKFVHFTHSLNKPHLWEDYMKQA